MMKHLTILLFMSAALHNASAQNTSAAKVITSEITAPAALEPLRFLAADELMGRSSTRPEIQLAARYIAEQYRSAGLKTLPGADDYFQTFSLVMQQPATEGALSINGNVYPVAQSLLQVKGGNMMVQAPVVYAGHGTAADLQKVDVKGKIVITEIGENDSATAWQGLQSIATKQRALQEKGALALIERYKTGDAVSWAALQRYFGRETITQAADTGMAVFWINDSSALLRLPANTTATLSVQGASTTIITAKNVIGYVAGTDAKLRDQYVVLSAHYDHLGVAKTPKMEEGKWDSIYNGARDNAVGTAAIINAARYFAQHPPKRSILFVAYTAEEIGEIGSKYFAAHPPIPLQQMVYNLNIDNAGYNNTSIVSVIGLGRTTTDGDIQKAANAFGLTAKPDPAPEQNLFDRSDNVNLAVHGIPAPTFSLGFDAFDETVTKRYHQLSDETGNFDMDYAIKYMRAFILAAKNIADNPKQPQWIKGDKYEAAWQRLYR